MEREFGPITRPLYRASEKSREKDEGFTWQAGNRWFIVDGYNVLFAWEDLRDLAQQDLAAAGDQLMEMLCAYAAFTHHQGGLAFDGCQGHRSQGEKCDFRGIHVVYTREKETGDMYIEKLLHDIGKNDQVRVVTSDGLIQLSAMRSGVLRMSALEFEREVNAVGEEIGKVLAQVQQQNAQNRPMAGLFGPISE